MSHHKLLKIQLKKQIKSFLFKTIENNYEKQYNKMFDLLSRTISHCESNSLLLLGPPGSGKTFLVEKILHEISSDRKLKNQYCSVKLNGLIHTDDKLALKSIIKQLLLEHDIEDCSTRSFAENLSIILDCFKNRSSKSLIFILDEFELFCTHHNQTLLYNLFDVSQSAQCPIFVLGITSNICVMELLEKRVKSRFSHHIDTVKKWNRYIKSIIENKQVQKNWKILCDFTKNHQNINNILFQFVSEINENNWPTEECLIKLLKDFYSIDSQMNMFMSLSVLEVSLLIGIKHHTEIYDGQPFNFKIIYERYIQFIKNSCSSNYQVEQQSVAIKAFQHLAQIEFIMPVTASSGGSGQQMLEHQMFSLTLNVLQINEGIKMFTDLPTNIAQWANTSVI